MQYFKSPHTKFCTVLLTHWTVYNYKLITKNKEFKLFLSALRAIPHTRQIHIIITYKQGMP
jgi:hypothetical protein